jgi:PAS domain S-box-containing protein
MSARNQTIQRKLTWVIMLTTTVALLIAGAAIIAYELVTYRKNSFAEIQILAQVMAANANVSLAYDNEKDATEVLAAFREDKSVVAAALYSSNNILFAQFPTNLPRNKFPERPPLSGHSFNGSELNLFQPVRSEDKRFGTLFIRADLTPIYGRIWLYTGIVLLVLAGSSVIALFFSKLLQTSISRPIDALVRTAAVVSEQSDYSIRAPNSGEDELGVLTNAFNHMLTQIQMRDVALSEKEERLRLALEGSQTATWDLNLQTGQVSWDAYNYRLYGLKPGAFDGTFKQFIALIHPQDREQVSRVFLAAVETKKEFVLEYRVVLSEGNIRHMSSRGKPFSNEQGVTTRLTGVTLDITESKQAEEKIRSMNADLEIRVQNRTAELTAANHELEAFTYSVAHDLRAPLRHVDGFAQMLQDELGPNASSETTQMVRRIRTAILNMGRLVDDLLNLARVGRQELNRNQTDLHAMARQVIGELHGDAKGRDVEWRVGSLPAVLCDPGLIHQVFSNLLSNALKYTQGRCPAIIEVGSMSEDGEEVIFIRDNGVGFNMKYASKLFGVFQRLHRPEEFEGTGVGLATVDRIVRKHGGRIWAEAEPEKGAAFYFTLERRPNVP